MKRSLALDTAKKAVCNARQKHHGDAAENFQQTADLWNAYLTKSPRQGEAVTAKDVAMMNILQKISRSCFNEAHADHYVDMAGYAALAAEITEAK